MYETEVLRVIQHSRAMRDKEPGQERKRESGAKIEDDKVVQVKKEEDCSASVEWSTFTEQAG